MAMKHLTAVRFEKFSSRHFHSLWKEWLWKRPKELLGIAILLVAPAASAASDVAGASDPLGLVRVPHSWVVLFENDDELNDNNKKHVEILK